MMTRMAVRSRRCCCWRSRRRAGAGADVRGARPGAGGRGDRVRARERALDEALRQAVEQAAGTVLEPDELVARASDLKLRIYPKAAATSPPTASSTRATRQDAGTSRCTSRRRWPRGGWRAIFGRAVAGTARLRAPPARLRAVVCVSNELTAGRTIEPAADERVVKRAPGRAQRRADRAARPRAADDGRRKRPRSHGAQAALVAAVEVVAGRRHPRHHARGGARARRVSAGRARRPRLGRRRGRARRLRPARSRGGRAARASQDRRHACDAAGAGAASGDARAPSGGVTVRAAGVQRCADYQRWRARWRRCRAWRRRAAPLRPRRGRLLVRTASPPSQLAAGLNRVPPPGRARQREPRRRAHHRGDRARRWETAGDRAEAGMRPTAVADSSSVADPAALGPAGARRARA